MAGSGSIKGSTAFCMITRLRVKCVIPQAFHGGRMIRYIHF